jgi:hypothetical protein
VSFKVVSNKRLALGTFLSVLSTLIVVSPFSSNSFAANETSSGSFLSAVKSAQPLKIEAARKKYVAPNTTADLYAILIVKHFTGTEYLKTLDKFGNVSPTASDAPGKLKKNKDGSYTLDSTFNTIDGNYKDFVLNKSKKITSFKFQSTGTKFVSTSNNLQRLTINFVDDGNEIKSGIHWKLPSGYSFVQVDYENKFGGLKSWSYARGYIRDASGVNHNVSTGPIGCTNSGGKTVIEATTSSEAAIVKNTTSTIVIPFFKSCSGDNANEIKVPFLVQ